MTTMSDFKKMRDDLNARIKQDGMSSLKLAFTEFFNQHPEVHALKWHQYTPYFNDGDTCEFSVYDVSYLPADKAKAQESDTDFVNDEDFLETWGRSENPTHDAVSSFWDNTKDDDIFQIIFGDHVCVLATRDGFTVAEYEHD